MISILVTGGIFFLAIEVMIRLIKRKTKKKVLRYHGIEKKK